MTEYTPVVRHPSICSGLDTTPEGLQFLVQSPHLGLTL